MTRAIRNIAIIAHVDHGKTTMVDKLLECAGTFRENQQVDERVMDSGDIEKERGITILAKNCAVEYEGIHINIIDTPGHVDFTVEVERSMRVLDGAVMVYCAVGGVQPQSETVWRQANKYKVPRIAFVNKMDRTGADFYRVITQMEKRLKGHPVPIVLPIGAEDTFQGVVDLIRMQSILWDDASLGVKFTFGEIPENMKELAKEWHEKLVENAAEANEELMNQYLETGELSQEQIIKGIRTRTIACEIQPMFCGSSFKNKGVQRMLDGVIDFLPSPIDIPPVSGFDLDGNPVTREADDKAPFSALAFKIMTDPYVGQLTFLRVYSGILKSGETVLNSNKDKKERIGRLLQMHANERKEITESEAGDIAAAVGLKDVTTGETLCDVDKPIVLERMEFPEPVISQAVEPRTKADQEKMALALQRLAKEDPSFRVRTDEESGQTIISGMGELHLEILVERMRREFGVDATVGRPQVAYRETIRSVVENAECKFVKQSGGRGQYGHVVLKLEPLPPGGGFEFVDAIKGGVVPREYIPAVQKGVEDTLKAGVLAGYPVVDVKVTLHFGSYHEVDSNENAFRMAASMAFKDGMRKADPVLLEPIMKVEVETPEEKMGDVMGDLSSRRGMIQGMDDLVGGGKAIRCEVPLAEMFGYSTTLRSLTQGRATYVMEFGHYAEAPKNVAEAVIEEKKK